MKIAVKFEESDLRFVANLGEVHKVTEYVGGELYTGEYTVTPKVGSQTMGTKNRVMVEDVTVEAIPFFDVSNTSGGSTVYIG